MRLNDVAYADTPFPSTVDLYERIAALEQLVMDLRRQLHDTQAPTERERSSRDRATAERKTRYRWEAESCRLQRIVDRKNIAIATLETRQENLTAQIRRHVDRLNAP